MESILTKFYRNVFKTFYVMKFILHEGNGKDDFSKTVHLKNSFIVSDAYKIDLNVSIKIY